MRHGCAGYDSSILPQFYWVMGESALERIDVSATQKNAELREVLVSTLILAAVGLGQNGRGMFISQVVFKLFKAKMCPESLRVLRRYDVTEDLYDNVEQRQRDELALYSESTLPTNIFSMNIDPEQTLKSLVKSLDEVSLQGDDDNA